jgi:LuxR family transcriptional regulator, maltose regulon positive regulatory protein
MRIFEAKFRMPPPSKAVISRPRLLARLDEAAECKLLVVTAPAGFGKTTLVSSWVRGVSVRTSSEHLRRPEPFHYAWLSLDDRENDLGAFLGHLIGAVAYALPGASFATENILRMPAYPQVMEIAQSLIADLDALPGNLTLVLDDYHVIHEPQVHSLIDLLISYSPEQFRLIILTRHDPPLPVARLYLQGRARQLRANDLRFLPQETEEFLNATLPREVRAETRAIVAEQAGGWIAQLRLAALLLQHSPGQRPEDVGDLAMDYLVEELLASESPDVRAFLLATSILERFCASLAEAMLQPLPCATSSEKPSLIQRRHPASAEVFRHVVEAGLFVLEVDGPRVWYRYHELFRQLLYQRLLLDHREEIDLLRRRAFEWLRARGFVEEALAQAQAMGDETMIADLVEAHVLGAIQDYQWQTAQRWIDMLPPAIVRERPPLLLAHSYALLNAGAMDRVSAVIGWAEQSLKDLPAGELTRQDRLWLGTLESVRAEHCAYANRLADSLAATHRTLELLPPDCLFERSLAMLRLQNLLAYEGKFEEGREVLRGVLRETVDERAPWLTRVRIGLALSYARAADFRAAKREAELVRQLFSYGQPFNECWLHYILGRIAFEWNDLATAAEHFRAGANQHGGNYMRAVECFLGLAMTAEARGEWEEAGKAVDQALTMAKALRSEELITLVFSGRARMLLMRREPTPGFADFAPSVRQDPLILAMPIEIPRITEANRLLASGKPAELKEAQRMMEEVVDFLTRVHAQVSLPRALALLALIYRTRDQKSRASETLARAVQLATPGGLIRSFLDLGPDLIGMLYELKLPDAAGDHVAAILRAAAPQLLPSKAREAEANLVESLTTRELAVLELVAGNLSDKEIAAALCISPFTVRKHTGNIFAKLDVRNRRQAAARALQLGLVG